MNRMRNLIFWLIQAFVICFSLQGAKLPEKKIVVVVPSYNNAGIYKECLDSILVQKANYSNFSIIYIDDASTDGTGDLVAQYIKEYDDESRIVLIRNDYNCKALANIYRAVHMCDDDDLVYIVDGDDALAHDGVLSHINDIYSTEDVWIAYAGYKNVPEDVARKLGIGMYARPTPSKVIESKSFRNAGWYWSGSRSFYAWLFKCIKLESLLNTTPYFNGRFYPLAYDWAIQMPMFEMATKHLRYIPEILMLRHVDTPLNDFKIGKGRRKEMVDHIKQEQKYTTLKSKEAAYNYLYRPTATPTADLIVYTENLSIDLEAFIAKCREQIQGLNLAYVIGNDSIQQEGIGSLDQSIRYYSLNDLESKKLFISCLEMSNSEHVLIAEPHSKISSIENLCDYIYAVEETFAHAFYLNLSLVDFGSSAEGDLPCVWIRDDIYGWKYSCVKNKLSREHATNMTLYSKPFLVEILSSLGESDLSNRLKPNENSVGLFIK